MSLQYVVTDTSITVLIDNVPMVVHNTHSRFEEIEQAIIRGEDVEHIKLLINKKEAVKKFIAEGNISELVTIKDGEVYYKDEKLNSALSRRMIAMYDKGYNIEPFKLFMENMFENPSYRAVNELYGFLEACNLPITEDGHFLAYKKINANYTDCYTGEIDNSIGATVEMPRNKVNEDPNQTCSYGLHVASYSYMEHYSGDKIVICKVNPRDVVAVPRDYNNSKMRVCKYEVVNEVCPDSKEEIEEDIISDEDAYSDEYNEVKAEEEKHYSITENTDNSDELKDELLTEHHKVANDVEEEFIGEQTSKELTEDIEKEKQEADEKEIKNASKTNKFAKKILELFN
jgi:hypothetical protein